MDPIIIQGGMGVGVSGWPLARRVAQLGQLGVVSGTAVAVTMARRLELGVDSEDIERALEHFPNPAVAQRVRQRHRPRSGSGSSARFRGMARPTLRAADELIETMVVANFVEVWLAKQGTDGAVGINLLEKIQLPTLPSLYGAMLAGVDYVLMGAGVPVRIPAALDALARHDEVRLPVEVVGEKGERAEVSFSPRRVLGGLDHAELRRPRFIAVVSSHTLATYLARSATGRPDGFVIESPTAGGHNAPPRRRSVQEASDEPVYGPRDRVDLAQVAELGLPFWLAGGHATPEALVQARAQGAAGVQIGTAFALCDESGLDPQLRRRLLDEVIAGRAVVRTDARASPTGFPFKVVDLPGTVGHAPVAASRPRLCDLGYLREISRRADGRLDYRCAAEPVDDYVRKGGEAADTVGRQCLCNGLLATIGLGQVRRDGYREPPVVTAGDDLGGLTRFLAPGRRSYTAADVIAHVLGAGVSAPV